MTVIDRFKRAGQAAGTRVAIECDGAFLTFADLDGGSNAAARAFVGAGAARGDRILLHAAASLDFVLGYLGALKAGAIAVPVNPESRDAELGFVLGDARPSVIVTDSAGLARASALAPKDVRTIFVIEADGASSRTDPRVQAFRPAVRKASLLPLDVDLAEDDAALLPYTSGTTGRAKGVLHSHRALVSNALALVERWRLVPTDRFLHALPLFHVHGLCVGLHGALVAGMETLLVPRFDAATVLATLAERDVTVFMGVPTMYARLVDAAKARPARPTAAKTLRLATCGSAPPPSSLAERVRAVLGVDLTERYGMTETLITLAQDPARPSVAGSVGTPLPGVEARLAHDGELEVRGETLLREYWNDPSSTSAAFVDGWFKTGDVARRNDDGSFTLVGRKKDFINTGGEKVAPREVEDTLLAHPAVAEVSVFGCADAEFGEIVAAAVVLRADARAEELIAWCRERLAPFKKPKRIEFVAALPRNAMGKIAKDELRRTIGRSG